MKLTIQIPTYIEVDKFKKDHKSFLKYLSKHCTYSIEQSSNGYGYTSFVCGPVREKSLHAFIDNYFKLFLEEIDEMKDTDFERICDLQKPMLNVPGFEEESELIKKQLNDFIDSVRKMNEVPAILSVKQGVWLRFKAQHPNTPESPDYSEASVKRWLYHINEAEKNKGFEKVELDMGEIEAIRKRKRVERWEEFDAFQKVSYTAISEAYPGMQVFACGSQVRGDYLEYPVFEHVKQAREKAGMRVDRISDFDFWAHPDAKQSGILPNYADRYRGKFNEKEMVAIPIYYGDV